MKKETKHLAILRFLAERPNDYVHVHEIMDAVEMEMKNMASSLLRMCDCGMLTRKKRRMPGRKSMFYAYRFKSFKGLTRGQAEIEKYKRNNVIPYAINHAIWDNAVKTAVWRSEHS